MSMQTEHRKGAFVGGLIGMVIGAVPGIYAAAQLTDRGKPGFGFLVMLVFISVLLTGGIIIGRMPSVERKLSSGYISAGKFAVAGAPAGMLLAIGYALATGTPIGQVITYVLAGTVLLAGAIGFVWGVSRGRR